MRIYLFAILISASAWADGPHVDCVSATAVFRKMVQLDSCGKQNFCVYDVTCGTAKDPNKPGRWTIDDLQEKGRMVTPNLVRARDNRDCPTDNESYRNLFKMTETLLGPAGKYIDRETEIPKKPYSDGRHYQWGRYLSTFLPSEGSVCEQRVCFGFANVYSNEVSAAQSLVQNAKMQHKAVPEKTVEKIIEESRLGAMLIGCQVPVTEVCPAANECRGDPGIKEVAQGGAISESINTSSPSKALKFE